ncbi:hypothetical protein FS749_012135 [Ceratobasidium sp. UAMH 11750]|nr:hypothetical protein FS749_012135 [Ceratobasidium sp. UAMH 11750]
MAIAAHLASAPTPSPPTPLVSATLAVPMLSAPLDLSPTPSIGLQATAGLEQEDKRDVWRSRARDWTLSASRTHQLDDFDTVPSRFVERLEIEGAGAVREPEWIMIGVCCVGAVLEFGRPNGVIKARGGLSQRGGRASTGNANKDCDIEMEDVAADDTEDLA